MPTFNIGNVAGGGDRTTGNTDTSIRYNTVLPNPRICSDGTSPARVINAFVYLAGVGADRSMRLSVANPDGSNGILSSFRTVPAGSSASTARGFTLAGNGKPFTGATSALRFTLSADGYFYFARDSSGAGNVVDSYGTPFPGSLSGYATYIQCPSAPRSLTVTPSSDGTSATIGFSAPTDDGGSALTGYKVQRSTASDFSTGLATVAATNGAVITGLTPGIRYYWRLTATNQVTELAGVVGGPYSSTVSAVQADTGLGRIEVGGVFVPLDGKIQSGGVMVPVSGKVRSADGTAWSDLGT
jgi:hypothetical protein